MITKELCAFFGRTRPLDVIFHVQSKTGKTAKLSKANSQ